jgi:hypothetical protein
VLARSEAIYDTGCAGGACAANVYWATYTATQAAKYSVAVTVGHFKSHVEGSPRVRSGGGWGGGVGPAVGPTPA